VASLSHVSADARAVDGGSKVAQAGQRMEVAVRVASRVGTEARQRSQRRWWPGLMVYVSSVSRGATWGVRWGGTRVGGNVGCALGRDACGGEGAHSRCALSRQAGSGGRSSPGRPPCGHMVYTWGRQKRISRGRGRRRRRGPRRSWRVPGGVGRRGASDGARVTRQVGGGSGDRWCEGGRGGGRRRRSRRG